MSKETTYSGVLGDLRRLQRAMAANSTDLAHLEGPRVKFDEALDQAQEIVKHQAALTASKQEASKQLRTIVVEAQRQGNILRLSLKSHYGIRSEKLAEFGLRPFRGRKVKAEIPEIEKNPPAAPDSPAR
ncbi:MAG TPA: hypothetical protein VMW27_30375 [Thermoanaerobaculia bacterium]|nr:hypothetical protein [Thermoanaerobaculia bacterium]